MFFRIVPINGIFSNLLHLRLLLIIYLIIDSQPINWIKMVKWTGIEDHTTFQLGALASISVKLNS